MRIEHITQQELESEIKKVLARHLSLEEHKVFFFGSRVSGRSSEYSDIDVGIKGPEPIDWQTMAEIENDIEDLPFLYSIDVVDFSAVSPEFRGVAMQSVEYINV